MNPEREVVRRVVDRLDREFAYHFRVESVLWEREPLIATEHFQTMITPPSETEIVVAVIWSRLGSNLPESEFQGKVTGKVPVTGTEWEFEDAVHGYRQQGKPDLLLYRKQARISADLDDRQELEARLRQKDLVEAFFRHWFHDSESGTFKAASHLFTNAGDLEEMLETHLRALLRQRLERPDEQHEGEIRWHQGSPFRGLLSFELEHAPIFFGRTRERQELRDALAAQAGRGCAFVLVFGASGSGKSSLVKAGVLADLKIPGMMEKVGVVRHAIVKPSDAEDLFAVLARGFLSAEALPELTALQYDLESLARLLRKAPDEAVLPIKQGLARAGEQARLINDAQARLLLIVDQLEELFTQPQWMQSEREGFVLALEALAKSGLVWVMATMRSDFFDRLVTLPVLSGMSTGEGRYLLHPPGSGAIGQIIRQPALEAGLRYEKDARSGIGLDKLLEDAASKDGASLPLLAFTLEALWERRGERGLMTLSAYAELGGLEGALGRKADEVFGKLSKEEQAAFPAVLRALVTVGQEVQGVGTARTVPLSHFAAGTPGYRVVQAFLHPLARLLVVDDEGGGARVKVVHEALLTHWPKAKAQISQDYRDLQLRGRLELSALRWRTATKQDK
ncbi:MAG: ATP-binding protein, partial [Magnetococcus sp. YQC-9]